MNKDIISIFGLGYVGEPLLKEFSKYYRVIGFDPVKSKVDNLKKILKKNKNLKITHNFRETKIANIFIVAVPTPIFKNKKPDTRLIKRACNQIGLLLKKKDIVIFESTVYPGFTKNVCTPILEKISGLTFNKDFYCGYSPERINPGDKKNTLTKIIKITSGSNKISSLKIDKLYKQIIAAGTFPAASIEIAEAAKVIENAQRDLNIAFVNELAVLFDKMNIDTYKVLHAAASKWNFLNFTPGLVGGHCIGVDPYYLTFIAKQYNYKPKLLLAGRKLKKENLFKKNIKILILGATFKENSDDLRNSKIFDVIDKMKKYTNNIDIYEPNIKKHNWLKDYNFVNKPKINHYECILVSVAHDIFKKMGYGAIKKFGNKNTIIFDIKNFLKSSQNILKI